MKQNLDEKQHVGIEKPHWVLWLVCATICGLLGGFFVVYSNSISEFWLYQDLFFLGLLFLVMSAVFDLLTIKDLIAEAHIMALEVFYGRCRAVKNEDIWEVQKPYYQHEQTSSRKKKVQNNALRKNLAKRMSEDIDD